MLKPRQSCEETKSVLMEEENAALVESMQIESETSIAERIYYSGTLWNQKVVVVFSRWGKVAAAATAVTLIERFNVQQVLFTGVAGAIDKTLNVGDVVVADDKFRQKKFMHLVCRTRR